MVEEHNLRETLKCDLVHQGILNDVQSIMILMHRNHTRNTHKDLCRTTSATAHFFKKTGSFDLIKTQINSH